MAVETRYTRQKQGSDPGRAAAPRLLPPRIAGSVSRASPGAERMSDKKPDFSGTWKFDPSRSALQIAPPDETVFVIVHREPVFRLTRTHVFGDRRDTFSLELSTDGRETVLDHGDLRIRARAYWDGDTLAFDSRIARAGEEATNEVRYTLSADRGTFVAEERFRSGSLDHDNTWLFARFEPDASRAEGES